MHNLTEYATEDENSTLHNIARNQRMGSQGNIYKNKERIQRTPTKGGEEITKDQKEGMERKHSIRYDRLSQNLDYNIQNLGKGKERSFEQQEEGTSQLKSFVDNTVLPTQNTVNSMSLNISYLVDLLQNFMSENKKQFTEIFKEIESLKMEKDNKDKIKIFEKLEQLSDQQDNITAIMINNQNNIEIINNKMDDTVNHLEERI